MFLTFDMFPYEELVGKENFDLIIMVIYKYELMTHKLKSIKNL